MNKAISFILCLVLFFSLGVSTEKISATTLQLMSASQEEIGKRCSVTTDGDKSSIYLLSENDKSIEDDIISSGNGQYQFQSIDFMDLNNKYDINQHVFRILSEERIETENIYAYVSEFQFFSDENEVTGIEEIVIYSDIRLFFDYSADKMTESIDSVEDDHSVDPHENNDENISGEDQVVEAPVMEESLVEEESDAGQVVLSYRTHVQSVGWQSYVENGSVSGTVGIKRRVEAIEINVETELDLGIQYTSLVNGLGWQEYSVNGTVSGTTGQEKPIEAVLLELTGEDKESYDLYYRVHASKVGWLGWAKNGEKAGTEGFGYQMEAIEIQLIKKGEEVPNQDTNSFLVYENILQIDYEYYDGINGWNTGSNDDDLFSPFMGLKINMETNQDLSIKYSAYLENLGWQIYVNNGETAGGVSLEERLRGVKIELTGEDRHSYDLIYRVKITGRGWLDWTKNGYAAGSDNEEEYMEDLEIRVVPKGEEVIPEGNSFVSAEREYRVSYKTHVQKMGWMPASYDGEIGGTLENLRMESIRISLGQHFPEGSIHYSTHIQSYGWMQEVKDGALSGTVGEGKRMEAISISLSGTVSELYDVYYRVKVQGLEWLGWAKNGETAGTQSYSLFIEAVEIKLVGKGEDKPVSPRKPFRINEGNPILLYKSASAGSNEGQYLFQEEISGTVGESLALTDLDAAVLGSSALYVEFEAYKKGDGWIRGKSGEGLSIKNANLIEAVKFELHGDLKDKYDIYYRVHSRKLGWMGWAKNGFAAGTLNLGLHIEAIELKILPKVYNESIVTEGYFMTDGEAFPYTYRAHIQKLGWQESVDSNEVIGTVGRNLRMEALELILGEQMPSGKIELGVFVKGLGWMESENNLAGTTGEGRRIEEISMNLTGYIAEVYDIYYRAHVQRLGWLDWAKNGEKAGSAFYNYQMEALEVKLVPKEEVFSGVVIEPYVMKIPDYIKTRYMVRNDCYTINQKIIPQGIVIHSTAVPGVMASQWFDRWNKSYDAGEINRQAAVHAFVDDKEAWQYLPWNHRGWHAGGKANDTHIGIEMVEPAGHGYSGSKMVGYDAAKNAVFFNNVWNKTVNLSVILARMYSFDHNDIISHNEGGKLGVASYSADVAHWFPYHNKTMDDFRLAVKKGLGLE